MGAERHADRCKELLEIMQVNPDWHMHQVSDGQRRRVQIVLGLLEPWELLLMDEVTVDLDVIVRARLLKFLTKETRDRGATILYATHIFDGLGQWPTHVVHMAFGSIKRVQDMSLPFPEMDSLLANIQNSASYYNSPLLTLIEGWLGEDQKIIDEQDLQNTKGITRWDVLSENMKQYGDKYYNYWG